MILQGSMVAVVTPFHNGAIDEKKLESLINWHIEQGTDAMVVLGTTGEAATISHSERDRIIRLAVDVCKGKIPVIAGTGSNNTLHAIELAQHAKDAGADAHLSVCPYYNKPTQEGLFQHYKAIAEKVELPLILYNVPGRTGVNMSAETTISLSSLANIMATKEACGDIKQIKHIIESTPENFSVFSGDDPMNLEIYKDGGKGCISVTANLLPARVSEVWDTFAAGDVKKAEELDQNLSLINKALFIESNPIPVKTALAQLGKCNEEFRLPITTMSPALKKELIAVMEKYHLLH